MVGLPSARDAAQDLARATDPAVTGSELLPYAAHRSAHIRAAVAARADTPAGALISLGHDHEPDVLLALLRNPRTPSTVVRKLADHRDVRVSDAAVQRLRNAFR